MGAFLIVAVNSENIDEYCNGKDLSEDAIESFVAALSPSMPGDVTVKRDADGALAGFIWGGPDLGSSSGGSDKNAQELKRLTPGQSSDKHDCSISRT